MIGPPGGMGQAWPPARQAFGFLVRRLGRSAGGSPGSRSASDESGGGGIGRATASSGLVGVVASVRAVASVAAAGSMVGGDASSSPAAAGVSVGSEVACCAGSIDSGAAASLGASATVARGFGRDGVLGRDQRVRVRVEPGATARRPLRRGPGGRRRGLGAALGIALRDGLEEQDRTGHRGVERTDEAAHRDPHQQVAASTDGRAQTLTLAADDDRERTAEVGSGAQSAVRPPRSQRSAARARAGRPARRRGRRPGPAAGAPRHRPRP